MNNVFGKLRSQTGATISFALLMFLVCTVLCTVILAAATAASGRLSRIAETDQRYYAVTSAAELLIRLIDGKTVSIVEVEETEYTTTYTSGTAGTPVEGNSETRSYIVPDKMAAEISEVDCIEENRVGNEGDSGFIENTSYIVDSIPKDAAKHYLVRETPAGRMLTLESTFYSEAGMDYDSLAVMVDETLDEGGNITLTIYNMYKGKDTSSTPGDRYTLNLTFNADRSEISNTKTENDSTSDEGDTYIVKEKLTETRITTLTWTLTGMKTK